MITRNVMTSAEYEKAKIAFLHKHEDWEVETGPMNQYGEYSKTYRCVDGATWWELNRPVDADAEVEICKCKVKVNVKMLETEGWSTESGSIYCYEKF